MNSMIFRMCAVTALVIGGMAPGCAMGQGRSGGQGDRTVGLEATGSTIELSVGQILLVRLPDGRARGRVWQLLKGPDMRILMPDDSRYEKVSIKGDGEREGDGELMVQELRFKAMGEGSQVLSLALVRPGAGLAPGDERWLAEVIVR